MEDKHNQSTDSKRQDFLFRMYDQMFNDINRHIHIIWQPITVLVGSSGLLAFGVKEIIPIDIAVTLIVILVGWLIANIYDSTYWYNRNLVIIANIERQFLRQSDLREIHYYFGEHRNKSSMLTHMRIQWLLGILIGAIILVYHVFTELLDIWPYFNDPPADFRLELILPYAAAIIVFIGLWVLRRNRIKSYANFIRNSPGIEIDVSAIEYGVGHPIEKKDKQNHQE